MRLRDNWNKLKIYALPGLERWPHARTDPQAEVETGRLGPYQLDSAERLVDGHFSDFDAGGLPVRVLKRYGYRPVHLYSTICCYALAHWDRYLRAGTADSRQCLLRVADYIVASASRLANGLVLLRGPSQDGSDHGGPCDALDLGQAISVLCRAYQVTGERDHLDLARACLRAFATSIENEGVRRVGRVLGGPWYEEAVTPPERHILNGMICALWGLRDLGIVDQTSGARQLYTEGVASVAAALPHFDTGYWSLYWVAEAPGGDYVATMNYHLLHVCQLRELWKQTGIAIFQEYAERFAGYAGRPSCRLRALAANVRARFWARASR